MGSSGRERERRSEVARGEKRETVRVWLLGGFRVSVGSGTIPQDAWRLRKAATLVKLLALTPGHRLHREQAMDLLWPDSGRKTASNSLRNTLHTARKIFDPAMGSRYLASEDESLVLCPKGDLWVDVDAFEEAAATARGAKEPAAYRAALDLYEGDLLPEDRYEQWTEGRREELRQLYLALLVELAGLQEDRDELGLAIETLRKATSKEPILEEAHVSLMRLHALLGRPERALAQYERLRDVLSRGLGTRPAGSSRRLRDEIAAGSFPMTPPVGPSQEHEERTGVGKHNLPASRITFVGREREMVEVKRMLAMTRLLTLTGAGGSGKTRLALEVARDLVGAYPDGVWLVELAPLTEGGLVTQEVARALGVQERPDRPLTDALVDALSDKELLMVVDNCEHIVEATALLVDALLDSCPRLRVLATSRVSLGVGGEVLWHVPPLSLPAKTGGGPDGEYTIEGLMRYEAVRLFVDRARLKLPDFELTQKNARAVARVCRRLDGIPLALELATARMGALAVEQVAQRLEASLDVLKGTSRTAAPRQQTLRATLDWSHNLLSEVERALFRRLSVFAGGWTLEAAEVVCSGDVIEQDDVLDLLSGLVDKSLVVAGASTGGVVRYRMLRPIRQYAREKLVASGETAALGDRRATFFLALAEEAEPKLAGSEQRLWVERLEGEHNNMRATLSWVLERGKAELGMRLGAALWRFWYIRGYLSEGIRCMERVLASGDPEASPVRVKALEGMGWLTQGQGDTVLAEATYEEMLELSQELDDKGNIATALNSLGTLALTHGDNEQARELLEENLAVLRKLEEQANSDTTLKRFHALNLLGILVINEEGDCVRGTALLDASLALARKAEDTHRVLQTLCNLGYVALLQGDYERVRALSEEARTLARDLGGEGTEMIPETLINSGLAALQQGHHKQADASFKEALAVSQEAGIKSSSINAMEGMASLAAALGEATRAARLWGAAEMARQVTAIALPPPERTLHEPYLASARFRLEETRWEEALVEGRAMALEEVAEYALSEGADQPVATIGQDPSAQDEPMGYLTAREQEVAALVARGLTNRQVSTKLSISERTAGNHVAKILKKLGLHSRAQIAAWAAEGPLPTSRPD
jgi:predicted ATPase/DNA-binding SARP family transcriptional activator/DNA-binding CsgD family transcriptional regulator